MENEEVISFIKLHATKPLVEIALLLGKKPQLPKIYVLNQINGWQKSKEKLPEWHDTAGIIYPDKLALEQSSSQVTAHYKAGLVSGESMADLTGGLGIDSYYFSKKFSKVEYIEPNGQRYENAEHNFQQLGALNMTAHHSTAEAFMERTGSLDFIYLDPDRRNENKKLVQIEDCSPNYLELEDLIFSKTNSCMLKYSPMLDISLALKKVKHVKQVYVVAVDNECKEILLIIEKDFLAEPEIFAVNLQGEQKQEVHFFPSEEHSATVRVGNVQKYIYEPNAAIRKAGAFKLLAHKFELDKLHINTHLYTSKNVVDNFPGRVFTFLEEADPKTLKGKKLNVISKNYPLKPAEIKKKYKIMDGGHLFLIASTLADQRKALLLCERLK